MMMLKQLLILLLICYMMLLVPATHGTSTICLTCDAKSSISDFSELQGPNAQHRQLHEGFPSLFVFGDSLADTGNGPFINKTAAMDNPYGITFPGYPFGRFSDGRIIADYLATYLSLPPVNPWLNVSLNFTHGANYAIPGAAILPNLTTFPLSKQISWHLDLVQQVINTTATTASRMLTENTNIFEGIPKVKSNLPSGDSLRESLYVLHFGVLDYMVYMVYNDKSFEWTNDTIVPLVIEEIQNALEILYDDGGARNFVVLGTAAQGCNSASLATLPSWEKDSRGCIASLNDIAWNHRQQLLILLQTLQELHVDATYTLVDLFSANIYIIDHAEEFGFTNVFDACCGAGDAYPYGYNVTEFPCSYTTTSLYLCENPTDYINWDGAHLTTSFYDQLFNQTFVTKSFLHEF